MGVEWVVGIAIALIGSVGGIIGRDRYIINLIQKGDERSRESAKDGDARLYGKMSENKKDLESNIDNLRDSVHTHYVGKDHFESVSTSLNKSIDTMNGNVVELNKRIDQLLKRDF